ncbi:hypothetical protein DAEQUDRAFT_263845 [Daedalea quercina L-15889]|uniref:Uncharacterized protein n=1 Tax=Daedalea quercina L-15889 TaxID=1314783 RepID=A0A165QFB7_9APHY|nr:hypothetical protein DAEQUDRAFT_263845 [Daedalea quercina L-15889]
MRRVPSEEPHSILSAIPSPRFSAPASWCPSPGFSSFSLFRCPPGLPHCLVLMCARDEPADTSHVHYSCPFQSHRGAFSSYPAHSSKLKPLRVKPPVCSHFPSQSAFKARRQDCPNLRIRVAGFNARSRDRPRQVKYSTSWVLKLNVVCGLADRNAASLATLDYS